MGTETTGTLLVGYNTKTCIHKETQQSFDYHFNELSDFIAYMKSLELMKEFIDEARKLDIFSAGGGYYEEDVGSEFFNSAKHEPSYVGMELCKCSDWGYEWDVCFMENIDETVSRVRHLLDLCGFHGEPEIVLLVGYSL